MVTERTIINALIIGASFILAPFVISSAIGEGDYGPTFFFLGFIALMVSFFYLKDRLCMLPLIGLSVTGSLNFLPLPFQASHLFCILLILYYISVYIIIRRKRIIFGKINFLLPILAVTSILLYHNHNLNVAAVGGETEGGKPAYLVYLVVVAYFCGINVAQPSVTFVRRVPFYFVIGSIFSCLPFFLTTFFPALAPYVFSFISNVNVGAYYEAQGYDVGLSEGVIGRIAVFGPLGLALQLYLLCHYPMASWLRPERWWIPFVSLVCAALVVASGFRNELFSFGVITVVGIWCHYSWRSLFVIAPFCLAGFMLLTASSNNLIELPTKKLPLIAQRSMSFLPGDWDQEAIASAKSSNDFRKNIQDTYIKEYMRRSPWIGNGYNISVKEYNNYSDVLNNAGADNGYLQAKAFIEGKIFHIGWISAYDGVGIVGSLAFLALAWFEIYMAGRFVFGTNHRSPFFPLYVWIFCNLVSNMAAFFVVFGDFAQTFSSLCLYALVLTHLAVMQKAPEVSVAPSQRRERVEFAGLRSASYSLRSKT
ncbi:MAG: O-antigen ligase family protein [Methylacidiphilales bacterium]|nr:O-antigen ligase family protein [Candidatus Methylacidiphilales bacterium]